MPRITRCAVAIVIAVVALLTATCGDDNQAPLGGAPPTNIAPAETGETPQAAESRSEANERRQEVQDQSWQAERPAVPESFDDTGAYARWFCEPFTQLVELVFVDASGDEIRQDATWGDIRRQIRELLNLAGATSPPRQLARLHSATTDALDAALGWSGRFGDTERFYDTYDFADLLQEPRFLLTMQPLGDAIFAVSERDADQMATACPALESFDEATLGPEFDDGELRVY